MSDRPLTWMEAFTPRPGAELEPRAVKGPPCKWCGAAETDGTPCPWSLTCPTCGAAPGRRCTRPSEHSGPFVGMHAPRYLAAEAMPAEAREAPAELVPMDAQLGLDGSSSDVAPASERMRLFEPAPVQIPGQLGLELEGD